MNLLLNKDIRQTKFRKVKSIFHEFEEIPPTWDFVMLEKVALQSEKGAIKMGPFGSSLKKHELLETDGIKTIWIENIIDNEFNWNYRRYITREKYQELKEFTVKPNDIVITMMGTVGRVAVIPNDIGQAIISSHLLKITLDQSKCLPKYMYYYLLSHFVERQIMRESRGIVMEGLNTRVIKSLLVKLPPIEQQQKIASILSKVDELIQKTNEIIEQTQRLKKGLLQRLLEKGIRHTRFKEVYFGPRFPKMSIPESWQVQPLSYLAKVIDSRHFTPEYTSHGMPLILPNNVKAEGLDLEDTKFTNEHDYLDLIAGGREPSIGDIVYSRNASFGVASRVETSARFSLGQDLVLIKPQKIDSFLLYLILNSRPILLQLARLNTGSTFQRINLDLIRSFLIPYPDDKSEQERISKIIQDVDHEIKTLKNYSQHLHTIKRGLMQKLLTGKIRVKV